MKTNKFTVVLSTAIFTVMLVMIFMVSCEEPAKDTEAAPAPPRPCTVTDDCNADEDCIDGFCAYCKCRDMAGYCEDISTDCAEGTFDWASLGCPQGRDGKCCMPDGSCAAASGECIAWDATCPEGTGAYGSMDCPDGRYQQCCIPVR
jgi:hypothetical protein